MNSVILIGRLTKDIELRSTSSGKQTASFTLAVDNGKDKDADFINCIAWEQTAINMQKYCKKGSQIAVAGRIGTRSYEAQDGTKRYVTEVLAINVRFLDTKAKEENKSLQTIKQDEIELSDDDLPF